MRFPAPDRTIKGAEMAGQLAQLGLERIRGQATSSDDSKACFCGDFRTAKAVYAPGKRNVLRRKNLPRVETERYSVVVSNTCG